MSNLTGFVKRLRDIMRNDAGINGDAQRIEQIAWMLFLKVYYCLLYTSKLRTGGDECVHKHGAVLSEAAPRRLDANVDFLSVFLCGLADVEIVLAFADVNVWVARCV